ncbi:hypothetical protein HDV57DRAFT_430563 [Trichoderma longibrachiatum]
MERQTRCLAALLGFYPKPSGQAIETASDVSQSGHWCHSRTRSGFNAEKPFIPSFTPSFNPQSQERHENVTHGVNLYSFDRSLNSLMKAEPAVYQEKEKGKGIPTFTRSSKSYRIPITVKPAQRKKKTIRQPISTHGIMTSQPPSHSPPQAPYSQP